MVTRTSVHRFHDLAGLSLAGPGPTRYLTAAAARALAAHLVTVADSIDAQPFGVSTVGTLTVPDGVAPSDTPEAHELIGRTTARNPVGAAVEPSALPPPSLFLFVSGGVLDCVASDQPARAAAILGRVALVDYDTGGDEASGYVVQPDGRHADANVCGMDIEALAVTVEGLPAAQVQA